MRPPVENIEGESKRDHAIKVMHADMRDQIKAILDVDTTAEKLHGKKATEAATGTSDKDVVEPNAKNATPKTSDKTGQKLRKKTQAKRNNADGEGEPPGKKARQTIHRV